MIIVKIWRMPSIVKDTVLRDLRDGITAYILGDPELRGRNLDEISVMFPLERLPDDGERVLVVELFVETQEGTPSDHRVSLLMNAIGEFIKSRVPHTWGIAFVRPTGTNFQLAEWSGSYR